MALFSFKKSDLKIEICFFGIKISFKRFLHILKNNKIYIVGQNGKQKRVYFVKGVKFNFKGIGAVCILPANNVFKNCQFDMYSNSYLEFKNPQNNWIYNLYLEVGFNCKIIIADGFKTVGTKIYNAELGSNVIIGKDCMFSDNTLIRTHDGHTIIDIATKQPINYPKDVVIGNHVWMAKNTTILKGVNICDNIIIATNSIVSKSFEDSNVILAGCPAKIVKTGVTWDIKNCAHYLSEQELDNG